MALVATDNQNYYDIADAIREKNGSEDEYRPDEMADAIRAIFGSDIPALEMPMLYYTMFKMCMEDYYTGDFSHVMIMNWKGDSDAVVAVVFLMDDFEVLSFDPFTTEFTAKGWFSCYLNQSSGEWSTADYRDEASTGGNYIRNVVYASREIKYNEAKLFPVSVTKGMEIVSATFDEEASTITVTLATGYVETLEFYEDASGNLTAMNSYGETVILEGF